MQQQSSTQSAEPRTEAARRILEASKILFAERGYDGVSIRDIAEKARVSKANVFHHFGNKANLYEANLHDTAEKLITKLEVLRDTRHSVRDRIARFALLDLQEQLGDPHCVYLFLRQLITPQRTAQRRTAEQVVSDSLKNLLHLLEQLKADGELPTETDPLALTLAIIGANFMFFQLQGILAELGQDGNPVEPEAFIRSLMHLITPAVDNGHDAQRHLTR
ncbi:MAG: TetR/AcrR family transcriptional regulator [Ectothiorhodospiraceae bacterium]|nr:TetR/AcrR family transcriptional regulator [Ectothiorhodospiraceae bacterium]